MDNFDDEIVDFNEDLVSDHEVNYDPDVVVFSRDWTVETIASQIKQGNIDLDPDYQRRNAWQDDKRSKLIESLIMEYPVPEVVLAESKHQKKKYIVIDGKQRLMAIYGFFNPQYKSWKKPVLKGLDVRKDLNNCSLNELSESDKRGLLNSDLRCTVISNYKSEDVLYDIFYRLNTGSSPLTTQELRQVLHKGEFAKFLIRFTGDYIPLHDVLNLSGPDNRLKDAEIVLKFISVESFYPDYDGNLKRFLDNSLAYLNEMWIDDREHLEKLCIEFNDATRFLIDMFGSSRYVGRKWNVENDKFESRFNRSVFESQIHYALRVMGGSFSKEDFVNGVKDVFVNPDFKSSVESTTKTRENHDIRIGYFRDCLDNRLGLKTFFDFMG